MFEDYTLESYMIPMTDEDIAIEASIDESLGGTKFAPKLKRMAAAAKAGDKEAVAKMQENLDEEAKKIQEAAKKEQNKQAAKNAISIAARAISFAAMIYGMINSGKQDKKFGELVAGGNGATKADIAYMLSLKNRANTVSKISTGADVASGLVNMIL